MISHLRIAYPALMFCLSITLSSCQDEETSPQMNNEILIFDSVKAIKNVQITSFGETSFFEAQDSEDLDPTHWYYDVYLSDDTNPSDTIRYSYSLSISFFSAGTDTLHFGKFKFQESNSRQYLSKNIDKNLFKASLYFDSNGNRKIEPIEDDFFLINDGTVTTSASATNFTINFKFRLYEEEYIEGSYSGEFSSN